MRGRKRCEGGTKSVVRGRERCEGGVDAGNNVRGGDLKKHC